MSDLAVKLQLPDSLKYLTAGLKASATKSKPVYNVFVPEGANYFDAATNRSITIPIASGTSFLDTTRSFLSFKVKVTLPARLPIEGAAGPPVVVARPAGDYYLKSAFSLFDELQVLSSGGAPLETIPFYGTLVNKLADACYDLNARAGADGALQGFSSANGYDGDVCATWKSQNMTTFRQGQSDERTFCIPLPCSSALTLTHSSGDSGALLMPLWATKGIKLRLTLRQNIADMFMSTQPYGAGPTSFSVSEVKFNACLIQDPAVIEKLRAGFLATPEQSIMISTSTWHATRSAVNADQFTTQVNEQGRSIKSLLLVNSLSTQENNLMEDYDASFGGMSFFQMSIGDTRYPQVPIDSDELALRHLSASVGQPIRGIINRKNFSSGITRYDSGANLSTGIMGIDCESFPSRDGSGVTHGMSNYGGMPIAVTGQFPTAAPAGVARVQKVYTHVDSLLVFNLVTGDQSLQV